MDLQCTVRYKRRHSRIVNELITTYANSITKGPGSRDIMGTFGNWNSGSNYRVVEVCDAGNNADHSLMRRIATDGVAWSMQGWKKTLKT